MTRRWAITKGDSRASLGPVKPLRCAPTPPGLAGLTGPPAASLGQLRDGPPLTQRHQQ